MHEHKATAKFPNYVKRDESEQGADSHLTEFEEALNHEVYDHVNNDLKDH